MYVHCMYEQGKLCCVDHFIAGKSIVPTSTFFPAVMWPWLVRHLKEEDDEVAVVLS